MATVEKIRRDIEKTKEKISEQQKRLRALEAQLKQHIQRRMGDATRARFGSGQITWKKARDSVGFDLERLLQDKPYLQAKYPLTKPGSRRFLIT